MAEKMRVLVVGLAPRRVRSRAKSSLSSKSHQAAISEIVGMFFSSAIVGSKKPVTPADSDDADDIGTKKYRTFVLNTTFNCLTQKWHKGRCDGFVHVF